MASMHITQPGGCVKSLCYREEENVSIFISSDI